MKRRVVILGVVACSAVLLAVSGGGSFAQTRPADAAATNPASADLLLDQARRYVEGSDQYLHHSRLRRGMKGYGLTVLAGLEIVRFDAEIISVVPKWGPHTDVILARLSGQGLELSGIIAGMSGSPVFIRDETDGKDKMIGAVAYGWRGCKVPICGIQPITQMLALEGLLREITGQDKPAPASRPESAIVDAAGEEEDPQAGAGDSLTEVLSLREKPDARRPWLAAPAAMRGNRSILPPEGAGPAPMAMAPLTTPLMATGLSRATLARTGELLAPLGLVPMQGGGVGAADAKGPGAAFARGGGIAVALVSGDSEMAAVGTVTEVIGQHVLAFGHPFFSEGDVKLPMAPAYIHSVIPGIMDSFKLGAGLAVGGTLTRDELTAVGGKIGPGPAMIPVTVTTEWPGRQRLQTFRYNVSRHRRLTAMLLDTLLFEAVAGWRNLPEYHHVEHTVTIDFGALGQYRATNMTSGERLWAMMDEAVAPVYLMLNNRLGTPPRVLGIRVDVKVVSGDIAGLIEDFRLDGQVYRPGETVTGQVTLRRLRLPRERIPVRFVLPADLPEGEHTLAIGNAGDSLRADMHDNPHLFDPQSTRQLLQAIQLTVNRPNTNLYLRLPLPEGGLALRRAELPSLPPSIAGAIADARPPQTHAFSRSLIQQQETRFVINGTASASFTVSKQPNQTLIRQEKETAHE